MVSSLSVFHPQEIKSLTSLSFTKSCCQKKKKTHSSAVTYGKKKRKGFPTGRETAEKEEKAVPSIPWDNGECQTLCTFSPLENVFSRLPNGANHVRVSKKWDRGAHSPHFSVPGILWAGRLVEGGAGLLLAYLGNLRGMCGGESWGIHFPTFAFLTFCAAPCHHCPEILWQRDYSRSLIAWSEGKREREQAGFHLIAARPPRDMS